MKRFMISCLAAALATFLLLDTADACSQPYPHTSVLIPADGSVDVPLNGLIVFEFPMYGPDGNLVVGVTTGDGAEVPGTLTSDLAGIFLFRPDAPLPADTLIHVEWRDDNALETWQASSFVTGASVDETAPTAPAEIALQLGDFIANHPGDSCGFPDRYRFAAAWTGSQDDHEHVYLIRGLQEILSPGLTVTGPVAAQDPELMASVRPGTSGTLAVCAIDVAGHETCSAEHALEVPAAPERSPLSCAVSPRSKRPRAVALFISLLAVILVSSRRRVEEAK